MLKNKKYTAIIAIAPGIAGRPDLEDLYRIITDTKTTDKVILSIPFPKTEILFYLPKFFDQYMEKLRKIGEVVSKVVFPSNFVRTEYEEDFDRGKQEVVYHGIIQPTEKSNLTESIVCVSRFGKWGIHKNHIPLIEAMKTIYKEIPMCNLYFIGLETEKLLYFVKKLRMHHIIKVLGCISEDEKNKILNKASVFALPSAIEAFGFAHVEALARGIPIVACHNTSVPEISNNVGYFCLPKYECRYSKILNLNENVLIEPQLEDLVDCILRAFEQKQRISAESRKVSRKYSLQNMAENYFKLINSFF